MKAENHMTHPPLQDMEFLAQQSEKKNHIL